MFKSESSENNDVPRKSASLSLYNTRLSSSSEKHISYSVAPNISTTSSFKSMSRLAENREEKLRDRLLCFGGSGYVNLSHYSSIHQTLWFWEWALAKSIDIYGYFIHNMAVVYTTWQIAHSALYCAIYILEETRFSAYKLHVQSTLDISNTRYLELCPNSNKTLGPFGIISSGVTTRYLELFSRSPESSRYRELTVVHMVVGLLLINLVKMSMKQLQQSSR